MLIYKGNCKQCGWNKANYCPAQVIININNGLLIKPDNEAPKECFN